MWYEKGGGKKIDPYMFDEYFDKYIHGEINQVKFSEGIGLSVPTLRKHLKTLFEKGFIDGVFFSDGKPMIMGYDGFIRGDEQEVKQEVKQEKVIYPILE